MPENDVWPPKPSLPDPLAEYDELIAAKLAASSPTMSGRLALIKALREQEGLDLRQAIVVVNGYCDRHGLFVSSKVTKVVAWGGCGLAGLVLGLACFNTYLLMFRGDVVLRQPHHQAALLALDKQEMAVVIAIVLLSAMSAAISLTIRKISRRKK